MGCGISMPKMVTASACLGKNAGARAVVDSVLLVLPAEDVMPIKKMDSAEDEVERHDDIEFPRSPSFNVFCTEGNDDAEVEKGKQQDQGDVENDDNNKGQGQGSSDGTWKRGTAGKGLKSVKQKFKGSSDGTRKRGTTGKGLKSVKQKFKVF